MNTRLCKHYKKSFKSFTNLLYHIRICLIRRELTRRKILRNEINIIFRENVDKQL